VAIFSALEALVLEGPKGQFMLYAQELATRGKPPGTTLGEGADSADSAEARLWLSSVDDRTLTVKKSLTSPFGIHEMSVTL
jgi:hypothetical protein